MLSVNVYNLEGKKTGEVKLPKEIFEVALSPDLVHQVTVATLSNKRKGQAHAKDRSERSGGGKKPWRQKGTGRARHGSIRSPLWRGGGVTFGPTKEKNYSKRIPKKMRRKALLMVLSEKAKGNFLIVLDSLKLDQVKTKEMVKIFKSLPSKNQSCLLALPKVEKNIVLSTRNIPKTQTIEARNLNIIDLLSLKYLVLPKESIKVIKETFTE